MNEPPPVGATCLPKSDRNATIEIIRRPERYVQPRFALFDFDGTLSLIREGWQGVMIPYFVEVLQATGTQETSGELEAIVRDFVTELTGKQTIYQCFALAEEVRRRGGTPLEALQYKHEYLHRLWDRIAHRVDALKSGRIDAGAGLAGLPRGPSR